MKSYLGIHEQQMSHITLKKADLHKIMVGYQSAHQLCMLGWMGGYLISPSTTLVLVSTQI